MKKTFALTAIFSLILTGCNHTSANLNTKTAQISSSQQLLEQSITLSNQQNFIKPYQVTGSLLKRMTIKVAIDKDYAGLTVYANNKLILDDLNIPTSGESTLNALVQFDAHGITPLEFVGRSSKITIKSIQFSDVSALTAPNFDNISTEIGLITEKTYKYGGPSVGDINQDGHYDFVLNNHNHIPTQLVMNNGQGKVDIQRLFPSPQDFHGSAVGDYDADGDLDIMVALGGANGTSPTSYALLNNNNGQFSNVSVAAGITTPARGRAPRWVDLDLDGKLDLALFNAKTPNYSGPQQLFYRNNGDATFKKIRINGLENAPGERVLVTDFNQDGRQDFVTFSPFNLWRNDGDFKFTNVSAELLPSSAANKLGVIAVTDLDVNNDGLTDLYLARGKTHYQLSRKSIDFNPETKKLDIRDDGETGTTAIRFDADGNLKLSDMELTYRQYNDGFAIFLGADKTRKIVKAKGFQVTQLPEEMKNADDFLNIAPENAQGWPENRDQNGLYIGYLGNGKWQAEWVRKQNIYWTVTFSLTGLSDVEYDWQANNRNEQDILLINQGDKFIDATAAWNIPKGGDHWGVTHGDLNNDGWEDLFVYRYGFLRERVADLILLNTGQGYFENMTSLTTRVSNDPGHGDMGQAFDFNLDGKMDLLNGSEEEGHWYLFNNNTASEGNYILLDVGYSPVNKVDPYFAKIKVTTESGKTYYKQVGSAGEIFSQSLINTVHFGLGNETKIKSVDVIWRNGEQVRFNSIEANALYRTSHASAVDPTKISLTKTHIKLGFGKSFQAKPEFKPLNANPNIVWQSSNNQVAKVNQNGLITAVSAGEAYISVQSSKNPQANSKMLVKVGDFPPVYVKDIQISGADQTLYVGQSITLTSELSPTEPDNNQLSWKSSHPDIISVSQQASSQQAADNTVTVTALSAGSATLSVAALGSDKNNPVVKNIKMSAEHYIKPFVTLDNAEQYKNKLFKTNSNLPINVKFNAGSGHKINDKGMRFMLREVDQTWLVINDIQVVNTEVAGQAKGSVQAQIPLAGLTPTADLPKGNFYFLFVQFTSTDGNNYDVNISPLNIVK